MSDFEPVSFDRPCPFCDGRITVTYNDANFGARACNCSHAGDVCEQWRAQVSENDFDSELGRAVSRWHAEARALVKT